MIDESRLSKLTVGDIADYEEWRRERRKAELISITKELYGDNIPKDSLNQIEQELRKIPNLIDGDGFDLVASQYLFWVSMKKKDPDVTMKQVGAMLVADELERYSAMLFPEPETPPQKKRRRQPVKKKKVSR